MLHVDTQRCSGCGACVNVCPTGAIQLVNGVAVIDQATCRQCQLCVNVCPEGAIINEGAPTGTGIYQGGGVGMRRGMGGGRGRGRGMGMGRGGRVAFTPQAAPSPPAVDDEIALLRAQAAELHAQLDQTLSRLADLEEGQ